MFLRACPGVVASVILVVSFVFVSRNAWPQGMPLGPEFRVNTHTTNTQLREAVASDSSGNFVVVWRSLNQDGQGNGIFGQRYDISGTPAGAEFRVNTHTTASQSVPFATWGATGAFVVVWMSYLQDGSSWGVFGQRYAVSGAPLGPEFRVSTYTTGSQATPRVASDSSGSFVVVWQGDGQDGSSYGVFGQRYASSGIPAGPEFRVNTYTTYSQSSPVVASDSSGNFVVVWVSAGQDGSVGGIFGQRYSSSGATLGSEFRVNTFTTSAQSGPAVASDASGNFVVVWTSTQDGSLSGVFGQRYANSGASLGPEFRVNTYTTNSQGLPSVAADSSGDFVVVWNSLNQEGSNNDIFGQRYDSSGTPAGAEFRVNTYTTNAQYDASVAADASGNFVVVWSSQEQDGSNFGIFGQRYGQIVPLELIRFGVE